jgi:hypothetical protein
VRQKNVGSGDSLNFNCGQNLYKAGVDEQACGQEEEDIMVTDAATDTDDAAATDTDDAAATDTDSLPNLFDLFGEEDFLGN